MDPPQAAPRPVNRPIPPHVHAYVRNIPLEVLHDTVRYTGTALLTTAEIMYTLALAFLFAHKLPLQAAPVSHLHSGVTAAYTDVSDW